MLLRRYVTREERREIARARAVVLERMARDFEERPDLRERVEHREQSSLVGAALGLSGQRSRAEIRLVARRASRLVYYYSHLWQAPERWEEFDYEGEEHLRAAADKGRGVILAPCHFGRYRWLLLSIGLRGHPVTLLADQRSVEGSEVDPRTNPGFWSQSPTWLWERGLPQVASEAQQTLWHLRLRLKEGGVVAMFTDGNSGVDGRVVDPHSLRVPFLGHTIGARAGIAGLSDVAGAPIVPTVLHDRGDRPPLVRFEPPLERAAGEGKRDFRQRVMEHLFGVLEREILARPQRWEEWHLLPKWILERGVPPTPPPARDLPGPLELGRRRLALGSPWIWTLVIDGRRQLVDLSRGVSFGGDPTVLALARAAEDGLVASAALARCPNPVIGFAALGRLHAEGAIAVD